MIALSIAATGIIAIAVALLVRPTPELRTVPKLGAADQRGITLQTLIVTAVLVLMAVAAGVVIVAITNAQSDNLNEANPDTAPRCEPWEIFDPTLAAAGRGGGQGGVGSSRTGCLRVCYVKASTVNNVIAVGEDISPPGTAANATVLLLVMSRTDISNDNVAGNTKTNTLAVTGRNRLSTNAQNKKRIPAATGGLTLKRVTTGTVAGLDVDPADGDAIGYDDGNMIIKVASNQQYCHIWNYTTDSELVRSSRQ